MRIYCFDDATRATATLPPGFRWSRAEEALEGEHPPCAAILRDQADIPRLAAVLGQPMARILPLVGLTSALEGRVDVVIGPQVPTVAGALLSLQDTMQRVERLPQGYAQVESRAAELLMYLAAREADIEPTFDPGRPAIAYQTPEDRLGDWVEFEAEKLASWGMLEVRFADQLNVCPACTSARLTVREECPSCRSPDVADQSIIHHFRCAEQAPESHFRQGSELVCPKCRQYLRHFSVDYDKPAVTLLCRACNHHTGEPSIGFRCLDCGRRDTAERLMTRRINSYVLTQRGRASAFDPAWLQGFSRQASAEPAGRSHSAPTPDEGGEQQTLVTLRATQIAQTGWRWLRPGTRSQAQERSKHLAQRLVLEYFAGSRIEYTDAPGGFDVRIDRPVEWVAERLVDLERHLKEFVAEPVVYEAKVQPWPAAQVRARR